VKDITAFNLNQFLLNKNTSLLFLFAGTMIMMVVMVKTGAPLKTALTPNGILDLEFAVNASETALVINAWKNTPPGNRLELAKINTWLDFIFIFFYSFFLSQSCRSIAGSANGFLLLTGRFLTAGALAAGLLDIFENTGMLLTLNGHFSDSNSLLTFIFAVSKWGLVLAAIGYILIAGVWLLIQKLKNSR